MVRNIGWYDGDARGIDETLSYKLPSQGALAIADIIDGVRLWHVWCALGWHDIRQRYRRSKIGPFWLTVSMGVTIGAIGIVYAGLFKTDATKYLPHVAIGFVVWGLISGLVGDGCSVFIDNQASIKQVRLPLSLYVWRGIWRNLIIFGHNFLIVIIVALIFDIRPGWTALLALPAVLVLCLNGLWLGLLFGLLSARFRDVPQIIGNAMQVVFFVTPIIWLPDLLSNRPLLVTFNPFFYAVEIVRAPLLGTLPPAEDWLTVVVVTFAASAAALAMYARFRRRIAYWI